MEGYDNKISITELANSEEEFPYMQIYKKQYAKAPKKGRDITAS